MCGGAYHKTAEPAGSIVSHKLHFKSEEVHGTLASSSTSTVGKKCSAVGGSNGTAKRAMAPNSSLDHYFSACEKGSDSRHGSDSLAKNRVLNHGLGNKAIHLSNSKWAPKDSEEEMEMLRFNRRPPRLRNQEPNMPTKETITQSQMKGVTSRKRQRLQGMQIAGKQEREPAVIIAWKQWCMFEDEEDGEMTEALVNKRDERRMSERYKKQLLQEHRTKSAGDVTGNCTSESNNRGLGTRLLPGSAAVQEDQAMQLQAAEHAPRSNTLAENDKETGWLCDSGSELGNCQVNVDTRHIHNDAREGGMAQLLFSWEQSQMDPTKFSTLEESTVDLLPMVIMATPEDGMKTSDKPMVQQSFCTKISLEEQLHGTHKSLCKGGTSCSERHTEELIINLDDDDEERKPTNLPGLMSAEATDVVDNEMDSRKGSNSTDNPNEPIVNMPSMSRSETYSNWIHILKFSLSQTVKPDLTFHI
jgi:hypothetical protein